MSPQLSGSIPLNANGVINQWINSSCVYLPFRVGGDKDLLVAADLHDAGVSDEVRLHQVVI